MLFFIPSKLIFVSLELLLMQFDLVCRVHSLNRSPYHTGCSSHVMSQWCLSVKGCFYCTGADNISELSYPNVRGSLLYLLAQHIFIIVELFCMGANLRKNLDVRNINTNLIFNTLFSLHLYRNFAFLTTLERWCLQFSCPSGVSFISFFCRLFTSNEFLSLNNTWLAHMQA